MTPELSERAAQVAGQEGQPQNPVGSWAVVAVKARSESSALSEAPRAMLAAHADDPAGALLAAEGCCCADKELWTVTKALVDLELRRCEKMNQWASRHSCVDVLDSHALGSNTLAAALHLREADQKKRTTPCGCRLSCHERGRCQCSERRPYCDDCTEPLKRADQR